MKTRRFDFNFRPLQINIGFAVDGSVPSTQNYDADTATYTPDYTLTPLIIQLQVSCMDKDEVLQAGSINHQLANIKWYEITGGVSTLIQSTDTHYEITASGSNAGRIKVKKNAAPRTPITLEFHAEFCDPRTGQIHSIIRTFLIKCTNATMSPPQLLLDAADQTLYNPLTDADEQTVHASLRVGMQECPVTNRAFVWDVYRPDTEAWTKVGADTTLDYDVEVAADGASCKVNRALMGHELHLRCRAKYDANGVQAKTVAINASGRAFTLYSDGVKTYAYPQRIALNAALQGTSECQWSYKRPGQSDFTDIPGATGAAYSLAPDAAIWGSNVTQAITLRCTSGDVHDEVTICKVADETTSNYTPNLLPGTKDWNGWGKILFSEDGTYKGLTVRHASIDSNSSETYLGIQLNGKIDLENDAIYTFSVWAKGTGRILTYCHPDVNAQIIKIDGFNSGSTAVDTQATHDLTSEWKRYSVIFRTKATGDLKNKNIIAARIVKECPSEVWVAGAKLEKGQNDNTQWTPTASEVVSIKGAAGAVSPNLLMGTKEGPTNWTSDKPNNSTRATAINSEGFIELTHELLTAEIIHNAYTWVQNMLPGKPYEVFVPGKAYTLSFEYKSDMDIYTTFQIRKGDDIAYIIPARTFPASAEWTSVHITNAAPENINANQTMALLAAHVADYKGTVGNWAMFRKFCIVEGTNDKWVPAALESDTIMLTNERHIFAGDAEKAVASSTECGVVAYKGATQMPATIGTITGAPTGMTVSVQDNSTTSAKFTVAVTSALTAKQGELTVPVTVDGKSFTKKFTWEVSLVDTTLTDAAPCKVVSFIRRIPKFEYDITGVPVNIPADILAIAPEASIWDANGAITDPERELLPLWYIATNKASGTLSYTQVAHGMTPIISTSAMSDNYGAVLGLDVVDAGPLSAMEDSDGAVFEDGDGNIILIK